MELATAPGRNVREPVVVPKVGAIVDRAREFARAHPASELVVGETISGGPTTALGVLRALGTDASVSSSLPENSLDLKADVVATGLAESGLERGDCAADPVVAVETMGDPVLAATLGLTRGAADSGTSVTVAGGIQLLCACALARHAGVEAPLSLASTSFVANDPTIDLRTAAAALDVTVTTTNPAFPAGEHPAMDAFLAGEAKEGVGMGGALELA